MYRTRPMTRNKLAAAILLSALAQPITIICLQGLCSNRPIDECKLTDAQGLYIVNMPPPFKPVGNGADRRTEAGRFVRGCSPGPGRPPRRTEQAYMRTVMVACSMADWTVIVEKAVVDARAGDAVARHWLSRYLLGNPEFKAPTPREIEILDASGAEEAGFQTGVLYAQINAKP
jgi:hypothetical protein